VSAAGFAIRPACATRFGVEGSATPARFGGEFEAYRARVRRWGVF
jgi:protein-S-isoprenylcysteine O-methyltransferase Ste14